MYTQELICPHCGEVATVNVLTSIERKNPQSSPCHDCNERIYYDVDSKGEIMNIRLSDTVTQKKKNDTTPRW
jgi:transposase